MFLKLAIVVVWAVAVIATRTSKLQVIDDQELKKQQKNPKLRLTPFSPKERNVDIYRRLFIAQPFNGCSPILNAQSLPDQFVLVDGRSCSYRQKAYHAMKSGARGVIIVDDDPHRLEQAYSMFTDGQFLSFLIDETQGMILYNYMATKNISSVEVQVIYQKEQRQKTLVELWVSAIDESSYNLLKDWNDTLKEIPILASKITWRPRYVIYGCINNSLDPKRSCNLSIQTMKSCACGGQFCSPSERSTTSNTILMEDMRQKDIFTRSPDKYMAYIGGIETRCLEDYIREKNIDRCSERVATDLNLNIDLVNERVEDAARKCKNTLYDQINSDKYMYTHVNEYPSFAVDKQIIPLRDKAAMKTFMCNRLAIQNEKGCMQEWVSPASSSWYFYMFLIIAVLASGFGVFLLYRRIMRGEMKREISMQVSTAIENYFSMNESK